MMSTSEFLRGLIATLAGGLVALFIGERMGPFIGGLVAGVLMKGRAGKALIVGAVAGSLWKLAMLALVAGATILALMLGGIGGLVVEVAVLSFALGWFLSLLRELVMGALGALLGVFLWKLLESF